MVELKADDYRVLIHCKIMATTKEIQKVWEEFGHDFYRLAEELVDLREENEKEVSNLQAEIDEHVCQDN